MHGSIEDVKNADVVVVNPEHIAVALRYNDDEEGAPRLMAKGQRVMAEKIKEVARRLFREKGFDNVTMREIAREIGIGVNVIYRNTDSKSTVLADILKDYIQMEISQS